MLHEQPERITAQHAARLCGALSQAELQRSNTPRRSLMPAKALFVAEVVVSTLHSARRLREQVNDPRKESVRAHLRNRSLFFSHAPP
jgi:hypothetical protein